MSQFGQEIITIQLGSVANYVGAHYFNIQNAGFSFNPDFPSELNHDLLFREGLTDEGAFTYTPRLVAVDLKQSVPALSESGQNFVPPPTAEEVQRAYPVDNVEVTAEAPPEKNEYFQDLDQQAAAPGEPGGPSHLFVLESRYDLTQTARSWSEILSVDVHPRSLTYLPRALTAGLDLPKSTAALGLEIWNHPSFDFEDNLRYQLEAADSVQGFHLLAESDNVYAGLSGGCLDYLRDECAKKSILTVPLFSNEDIGDQSEVSARERMCCSLINSALSFAKSNELSDLICPLSTTTELWNPENEYQSFDNLSYVGSSLYQSCGVLAAGLELLTTPYRLKRLPESRMSHTVALLGLPGRKFLGAGVVLPFPDRKIDYDVLELLRRHRSRSLCPQVRLETTLDVQAVTLKGFPPTDFPRSLALCVSKANLRLPRTYPDLVPPDFDLSESARYYGRLREVSALSVLANTREMRGLLDRLLEKLRPLDWRKIPSFLSSGLEKSDFNETIEVLRDASASYDVNMFL